MMKIIGKNYKSMSKFLQASRNKTARNIEFYRETQKKSVTSIAETVSEERCLAICLP